MSRQTRSLKIFQGGKIEIFGPSQSPTGIKGAMDQILPWKAPNDPKTLHMGILHDCKSCWPPMGPLRYPRGAQKGPFGLKQTLTGRKAPERPMTPQECPKQHKTLCLVGLYWYNTFWRTSRPFGHSPNTYLGWLHLFACLHTILAFPGTSLYKVIFGLFRPQKWCFLTFSPTGWFNMSCNCIKLSGNSVATIWTPHMPWAFLLFIPHVSHFLRI